MVEKLLSNVEFTVNLWSRKSFKYSVKNNILRINLKYSLPTNRKRKINKRLFLNNNIKNDRLLILSLSNKIYS